MEYSKDIILGINYAEVKRGQAIEGGKKNLRSKIVDGNKKIMNLVKRHKVIATISIICGILMVLDYILVHNFIELLQTLA